MKKKSMQDQYPNEAKIEAGKEREMNEDNYFRNHDFEQIAKKYLQFTVFMEALNEVLELPRSASVEQFAYRIRDLVYASQKKT